MTTPYAHYRRTRIYKVVVTDGTYNRVVLTIAPDRSSAEQDVAEMLQSTWRIVWSANKGYTNGEMGVVLRGKRRTMIGLHRAQASKGKVA